MTEQGVRTTVRLDGDVDGLTPSARTLIYRVIREGAHNVLRHSGADEARIEVIAQGPTVRVSVWDDGVGPDSETGVSPAGETRVRPAGEPDDKHFGLALLAEAISDLDGVVELRSAAGGGTEFVVILRKDRLYV